MAYLGGTWQIWMDSASTTAAATTYVRPNGTGDVWYRWATTSTATTVSDYQMVWVDWARKVEETHEQKAARLDREAKARIVAAERAETLRLEKEAAVAKAEVLLREHLSAPQRDEYDRLKTFLVEAQSGRVYRIRKGWSGNVELLNDADEPVMRFCIHPSIDCPDQDNMLAQKLLLEADEEAFNRIANKTQLRVPAAVR